MNLICPICLSEYPCIPSKGDINCKCGGHFSFANLKWTYKKSRLKELPPVIKLKDLSVKGNKKESD